MRTWRIPFVLVGALALSVFLLRPLCSAAHPQWHAAQAAPCCQTLAGAAVAKPLELLVDTSGKPLAAPPPFAYLIAAAFLLTTAIRLTSAAAPPRSYYARSTRILR
jgi:hypothetical protein